MNMHKLRLLALLAVFPVIASVLSGCVAAVVGGAGTAVLVGEDRRTVGTVTEDQGIELKSGQRVGDRFKDAHINITSFSRMVLITGEVKDAATRTEIEKIVRAVENVRGVYNEITVGNVTPCRRAPTIRSSRRKSKRGLSTSGCLTRCTSKW